MSQISWGLSQQNRRTLVIGGNEFTKKNRKENGNIHWKCSRWGSHVCKTTAITRDNDLISCRKEHTHEVFPGRSNASLLVQKMKQDTKTQQVPVNSIIIANGLQSVSEEHAVKLALFCRSAINRALNRQKVNKRPRVPPIVDRHFEITKQHEDFCVIDSGIDAPERVLTFGDRCNIQSLKITPRCLAV